MVHREVMESGNNNEIKESEMFLVSQDQSGYGLPYAPENFPQPGDKWGWKVGKRVTFSGNFVDRYVYLPQRLQNEYKSRGLSNKGFATKASLRLFLRREFPGTDIKAFFASFTWKIPAGETKGCKAGYLMCSSRRETSDSSFSDAMACDTCCIEPDFCRDCCCILCSMRVDSTNDDLSFIRCEARFKDGVCGHICHIECGVRSYMAGTVGGAIGLDAEYYCRCCDSKTDLVPHVTNLLRICESIPYDDKVRKMLSLCVLILRGSSKRSAKTLLDQAQSAQQKLNQWNCDENIWKREDRSAVSTGEVSNLKEASQISVAREIEEGSGENVVDHLLDVYEDLEREKLHLWFSREGLILRSLVVLYSEDGMVWYAVGSWQH